MRMATIVGISLAALLGFVVSAGTAMAQVDSREGIALQNQMYQLRQELQILRDQVSHGGGVQQGSRGGGGGDMVAQLLTRVDGMDEQLRQLRGRIDELQNQSQRHAADVNKRLDDLAYQMNSRGDAPTATAPAAVTPPPPAAAPRARTAEAIMQEGNAALARRDYPLAEQAAREVLANKASPRAYDGQLLLAQALFGQRNYSNAAVAYDDTYNRTRKGAHAQDALLGLANSLTAINEKKAACGTLDKLRAEFPQPRADLRDGIATASQRAGCR